MEVNLGFGVYYGTLLMSYTFNGLRNYNADSTWYLVIGRLVVAAILGGVCMSLKLIDEDQIENEYVLSIVSSMLAFGLAFFCMFAFADKICASLGKIQCWKPIAMGA